VEEVTGEPIDNMHRMSVVMGVIDSESMKHTSAFQGAKQRADILQRKVIEFANLMSAGTKSMDNMDIGRLERQQQAERSGSGEKKTWADAAEEDWNDPWQEDQWMQQWGQQEAVPLSAVDTKCHKCGGLGHYATQCPSQATGSGKDGGKKGGGKKGGKPYSGGKFGSKGLGKGGKYGGKDSGGKGPAGFKGKGQGPAEGCWTCGGARFAWQCPQNGGDKGHQKGGIRSLCGLQTVTAPMDKDLFDVFRRVGRKYIANISRVVFGKESFYPIVSNVSEKLGKGKMCGTECCNRFDCFEEEVDDFEPIGNPSLNVNVERASRAKMEFEAKSIPLMGSGKAVKRPEQEDTREC